MSINKIFSKIFFIIIIIGIPLYATYFIYENSSINYHFDAGQYKSTPNIIKNDVLNELAKRDEKLKILDPLIKFGYDNFLYNVSVQNNMKLAVTASEPEYDEYKTTLILESKNTPKKVSYGDRIYINTEIKREEILKDIDGFSFSITPNAVVYPNQKVEIQYHPHLGGIYVKIELTKSWLPLIIVFLTLWIFITSLLVLFKESINIITQGFKYFIKTDLIKINMDNKEKTKETYNKIAGGYSSSHFAHFWVKEFDFFKSIINGKKVIDIGCGAGRDAAVFVENDFDYTGVDASEGMLKVASERVPKGVFKQMDFYKLDFPNESFDCFWAAASFLHVPKKDIASILQETKRITKKDGVGFISVKEKTQMDEGMIEENKYGGISRYFSFYAQEEFKNILEQNGFSIVKMTTHLEGDEIKTNWLCYFVKNQ